MNISMHIPINALWVAGNIVAVVLQVVILSVSRRVKRFIEEWRVVVGAVAGLAFFISPVVAVATNGQPWAITVFAQMGLFTIFLVSGDGSDW